MLRFDSYRFALERQPLSRPFHFKGGFFTEKWLNVLRLEAGEHRPTAVGGNAVLWSDPAVFFAHSECGGNALMSLVAERAAILARGNGYPDPISAFQAITEDLHRYARRITGRRGLALTFTLNAMVALDLALWKLHAAAAGTERWLDLLPPAYRPAFDRSTRTLARAPLVTYNAPVDEVRRLAAGGHRVLKIKLGQAGSRREMLDRDKARLAEIHRGLEGVAQVAYYLDANGRYLSKETLLRLLEHADRIGMLGRIILLEEPFPYRRRIEVGDLPVPVAADESLHGPEDLEERIALGYSAVALKPAGKTLSQSVLLAAEAMDRGVACFVADSACVPMLVEWNKVFAAHLPPLPGLEAGLLESNGEQNYANWADLVAEHPMSGAPWIEARRGTWTLDDGFFAVSGGVFRGAGHYEGLVSDSR